MTYFRTLLLSVFAFLIVARTAGAQMRARGITQPQPPLVGEFKPTVGAGAQFQMTDRVRSVGFAIVVVGKETVDGADGYWMEQRFEGGGMPGEMVQKQLLVMHEGKPDVKRMIMQPPGRGPMEIPVGMMHPGMPQASAAKDTDPGEKIGPESVTVPAGTFDCEHYRKKTERGSFDYWISPKVSPYPIVKATGPEMTMVLEKLLSGETSHIHGEPQQMPSFPRPQ